MWNTLSEEAPFELAPKGLGRDKGRKLKFVGLKGKEKQTPRRITKITEFDRVCGGGLVSGSVLLLGGDPGIGKSTLLIQVVAALSRDYKCMYISGEEAIDQLRLRATRLDLDGTSVKLGTATSVRDIVTTFDDQ